MRFLICLGNSWFIWHENALSSIISLEFEKKNAIRARVLVHLPYLYVPLSAKIVRLNSYNTFNFSLMVIFYLRLKAHTKHVYPYGILIKIISLA